MGAITGFSAGNHLQIAAGISDLQMPYMFSVWSAWGVDTPIPSQVCMAFSASASSAQNFGAIPDGNITARDGPVASDAIAGPLIRGRWIALAAAYRSNALRDAWQDEQHGQNTTAGNTTGVYALSTLGCRFDGVAPWLGALASPAIWNLAGLSDAEIQNLVDALRAGIHPLAIDAGDGPAKLYRLDGKKAYAGLTSRYDTGPWQIVGEVKESGDGPPIYPPHPSEGVYDLTADKHAWQNEYENGNWPPPYPAPRGHYKLTTETRPWYAAT